MMKERYLEVRRVDTDEVVHRVDVSGKGDLQVSRIERGMRINMDDAFYITDTADGEHAPRG